MEITNRHSAAEAANQVALTPAVAVDPMNMLGFEEWLARRGPLAGRDLEKWQDFVADSAPGRCSKHSPLAWVFYRFEEAARRGRSDGTGVSAPFGGLLGRIFLRAQADHFDPAAHSLRRSLPRLGDRQLHAGNSCDMVCPAAGDLGRRRRTYSGGLRGRRIFLSRGDVVAVLARTLAASPLGRRWRVLQ